MIDYTVLQGYTQALPYTLISCGYFLLLNFFHFCPQKNTKNVLTVIFGSLVTSYWAVYTIKYFITAFIKTCILYPHGLEYTFLIRGACTLILTLTLGLLGSMLYRRIIFNTLLAGASPYVSFYIYLQHLTTTILSYCISSDVVSFALTLTLLSNIWYILFKPRLNILIYRYPSERFHYSNFIVFFEFLMSLCIWVMPNAFLDVVDDQVNTRLAIAIFVISIVLFFFSIFTQSSVFSTLEQEDREYFLKNRDPLTQLMNRDSLLQMGNELLTIASEEKRRLSVAFLNIEDFKTFNSNFGMYAGDDVLISMGRILRSLFPENSLVARVSDDHFVVVQNYNSDIRLKLFEVSDQIKSHIYGSHLKTIFGIYITTPEDIDMHLVIDKAKTACDEAKNQHTSFLVYDESLQAKEDLKIYILEHIDEAIKDGEIRPYYQPIVDTKTRKIISAECLVRWESPTKGFLSPADFIPLLEDYNLTYKVDCHMVERLCKDHRKLLDSGRQVYPVSVNFSRKDFYATDIPKFIDETLRKYDLPKSLLKVEITESAFLEDDEFLIHEIEVLRKAGYRIWMDDFGSGYSSLTAVKSFDVDGVKLDMDFLRAMNDKSPVILKGIIQTAHALGLETLCEGCETEFHYNMLNEYGCDMIQGYLFGKPDRLENELKDE